MSEAHASGAEVLAIDRLTVELPPGSDRRYGIEDLSLTVGAGEIVCVVGESGSGKSVSSFSVMGLLPSEVKPVAGSSRPRLRYCGARVSTLPPWTLSSASKVSATSNAS